jgi:hypothetical protein
MMAILASWGFANGPNELAEFSALRARGRRMPIGISVPKRDCLQEDKRLARIAGFPGNRNNLKHVL